MVKNNLIKINDVDVSAKRISVEIRDEYQEKISSAVIRFRFDVNQITTISKFQEVIIWENFSGTLETDLNRKFIGNIAKIERTTGEIKVTCFGNLWKAIQSEVNQTFDKNIDSEAGEGSEIFINMAGLAGLTADSSSVQPTGTSTTSIVLDKFVCKNAEIYERMQALADIYDFQFYYRPSVDKVFFEPRGFELNSNVIQVGGDNNNVQGFPKWTEDSSKIFNRVEIKGRFLEPKITELFDGTGSQTTFTLNFEPEIVTVTVDGDEQIGGVLGSTSTFDYSVDKSNKQIVFESGSIPGGGSDNVVILYSYRVEKSVFRNNESSIAELDRTISNRFTFSDIESVDDAERRADKLLEVYSDEFVTTKIKVNPSAVESFGLEAGQSIRVIDSRQEKDLNMVIKTMISRFPENDVELLLGDKEVKIASIDFDNSKRLKRIEEEMAKGSTFITESKDLVHVLNLSRRDIRVNSQDYNQGAGYSIWGLGTANGFFDWGSGKWGTHDDAFEAEVEHTINQTNNIYDENFEDDDYEGAGNASWSNTGSVSFTSGQIALSKTFLFNDITVVSLIITPTEVSGSFDYEIDTGSGFETVAKDTRVFLSNTGTSVKFKITENSASTGLISNLKIEVFP
jgi:hypothetical protein